MKRLQIPVHSFQRITIAVLAFCAGFIACIAVLQEWQIAKEIFPSLATLLAAFLGASFAFLLQNRKQERDEKKKQITGVNRAIYMIYDMWNVLFQYQIEVINPIRERPDDWLNMPASLEGQFHEVRFPAKDLVFLLGTKHADLYTRILLEEQRYTIAMGSIRTRSRLVYDQLHPKMENLGFKIGEPLNLNAVEESLGPDLTNKLKQITRGIINNVDEDVASLRVLNDDLRNSMIEFFETNNLLKVEFQTDPTEDIE
jgi:hypothetical protein